MIRHSVFTAAFILLIAASVLAGNATVPGELSTPYPTIINLGILWKIQGDDDLDGRVDVRYRRVGESAWKNAMPLRRVPAGKSVNTRPIFEWENRHAGSIFDLKPGTEYEINLKLTDPDGGSAEKTVRAKTRAVPRPMPGAPVKEATPTTFKEVWGTAKPGDIIELTYGFYREFEADKDGLPGKPIVIRSKEGGAVFDGISLEGRKYVQLDGLNVWGQVDLLGGEHLTVRRCTVSARYAIVATRKPGAKNCYIADNVVTYKIPWESRRMGHLNKYDGAANVGEGIEITGPGNVICYNYVSGFRDNISTMEDGSTAEQVCIDIYNNDVFIGGDDGIEADFCMHNCRIMRNRLTNCFHGISSQPGLGGPTYIIRNVMYNLTYAPFKLSRHSVGDVVLHNTAIKVGDGLVVQESTRPWSYALFRNNLGIGGIGGGVYGIYDGGIGRALYFPGCVAETCDFDYDAVGTYLTPFEGQIGDVTFSSIEELRSKTSEKHAVQVDMTVFNNVPFPNPPVPAKMPPDLRPLPGSAVVDVGQRLANVNDGYLGDAPDIGAYEAGQEMPHYGPRPAGVDEETTWGE
ncbi:right-handed parallel beta-helix repeat-containing protein [candidate division KSB1 bacterium]